MIIARQLLVGASLGLLLAACSDSNNNSNQQAPVTPVEPTVTYSAEVRRTEYGTPISRPMTGAASVTVMAMPMPRTTTASPWAKSPRRRGARRS